MSFLRAAAAGCGRSVSRAPAAGERPTGGHPPGPRDAPRAAPAPGPQAAPSRRARPCGPPDIARNLLFGRVQEVSADGADVAHLTAGHRRGGRLSGGGVDPICSLRRARRGCGLRAPNARDTQVKRGGVAPPRLIGPPPAISQGCREDAKSIFQRAQPPSETTRASNGGSGSHLGEAAAEGYYPTSGSGARARPATPWRAGGLGSAQDSAIGRGRGRKSAIGHEGPRDLARVHRQAPARRWGGGGHRTERRGGTKDGGPRIRRVVGTYTMHAEVL